MPDHLLMAKLGQGEDAEAEAVIVNTDHADTVELVLPDGSPLEFDRRELLAAIESEAA